LVSATIAALVTQVRDGVRCRSLRCDRRDVHECSPNAARSSSVRTRVCRGSSRAGLTARPSGSRSRAGAPSSGARRYTAALLTSTLHGPTRSSTSRLHGVDAVGVGDVARDRGRGACRSSPPARRRSGRARRSTRPSRTSCAPARASSSATDDPRAASGTGHDCDGPGPRPGPVPRARGARPARGRRRPAC